MSIRFHKQATAELDAAGDWYESRRDGLGQSFAEEVSRSLDVIAETPVTWPIWPGTRSQVPIRRFRLPRFPFSIAFLAQGDTVIVLAVAHNRRKPLYWLHRAP
jgi:toxin ParE1/3/4